MRRVIVFFGEFLYGSLKVWVDGAEKSVAFGQGPDSVVRRVLERALAAEASFVLFVGDSTARLLYIAFVHVHVH